MPPQPATRGGQSLRRGVALVQQLAIQEAPGGILRRGDEHHLVPGRSDVLDADNVVFSGRDELELGAVPPGEVEVAPAVSLAHPGEALALLEPAHVVALLDPGLAPVHEDGACLARGGVRKQHLALVLEPVEALQEQLL